VWGLDLVGEGRGRGLGAGECEGDGYERKCGEYESDRDG